MYIVNLAGCGDRYYFLIDQEMWDWIHHKVPTPQRILDMAEHEDIELPYKGGENDRALDAMCVGEPVVDSIIELQKQIKTKAVAILGEYTGYFY